MENIKIKCPKCSSENVKKDGLRKTENRGNIQRYKCKDCSHRFSIDDGFWKMKHRPEIIAEACSCRKRGMPFSEVSKHFKEYKKVDI